MANAPWAHSADGVIVDVRLTPRGGRDAIEGIERRADGRVVLKARVRAAASDGAANAALTRLLADAAGVPAGRVTIVGGASSRLKRVRIAGEPRSIAAALERSAGHAAAQDGSAA